MDRGTAVMECTVQRKNGINSECEWNFTSEHILCDKGTRSERQLLQALATNFSLEEPGEEGVTTTTQKATESVLYKWDPVFKAVVRAKWCQFVFKMSLRIWKMTTAEVMPTTALEALVEQQNKEASQQRIEERVRNKEMTP